MKKLQLANGSITKTYTVGTGTGQLPPGTYRAFFKGDFNSFATLPATYAIGTDGLTTDVQKDIKKEQLSTSVDGWNYAVDEDRKFWKDDCKSNNLSAYNTVTAITHDTSKSVYISATGGVLELSNYPLVDGVYEFTVQSDNVNSTTYTNGSHQVGFSFGNDELKVYMYAVGNTNVNIASTNPWASTTYSIDTNAFFNKENTFKVTFSNNRTNVRAEILGSSLLINSTLNSKPVSNKLKIYTTGLKSNVFIKNITFSPSLSYSDSFTSDTSARYQAITGTTAYDAGNTRLSLTAPAATWNMTRLKSYKFESGRFTQKLVLPATGHEGDIVAHFFNSAADGSTNYGVGLKRLASNLWLPVEIVNDVVVTTGTSPLTPLQDGHTAVLEVEEDQIRGVSWLSVWKDGSSNVMAFDGVDDYIDCGNNQFLNITGALSIVAVVNYSGSGGNSVGIVDQTRGTSANGGYSLSIGSSTDKKVKLFLADGAQPSPTFTTNNDIPPSLSRIVATYDGTTVSGSVKIYFNGIVQAGTEINYGTSLAVPTQNTFIAKGFQQFSGQVKEVSIYNRVLSQTEALEFETGKHITTGLVAHYVNTGNTNADWVDRSGNGNNGTVYGSPATTSITGSKLTGTTLKQFANYQLAHTAAGFYNAHTAENTAGLELMESRARSMIGYTNVPATESVSFTDDFNENSIGKYTTTGTHAITGNELVCSVAGTVKLQNTFGNGTYQYSTKIANGSTDYFYFGSHRLKLVQYASSCDIKLETSAGVQVGSTTWNKTVTAGSAFTVKVVQAANSIIVYDGATAKITETPTTGTGQPYWSLTANSAIDSISVTANRSTYKPMLRGAGVGSYWDGSAEVACARFTDDFNSDTSNEWSNTLGAVVEYDLVRGVKKYLTPADNAKSSVLTNVMFNQPIYDITMKITNKIGKIYIKCFNKYLMWWDGQNRFFVDTEATLFGGASTTFVIATNDVINFKVITNSSTVRLIATNITKNTVYNITDSTNFTKQAFNFELGFTNIQSELMNLTIYDLVPVRLLGSASHGGFFLSDGSANTGNWAGLKFTNHDRDATYTNIINVGTSTVTDGTGIYYDLVRKNLTDNSVISPTKAMTTSLPIGTASTQTATDITLGSDDVGDDIALYVAAKSDSAPVLQITSETLTKNDRIDTTDNNYYYVDLDIDEADIGKTVQIGVFQNDQPSDNYYILDYLVMSPTELIEKHAKRALWNASPMTKTMKSSIR